MNEIVANEAPEQNLPLQSTSLIGRDQELLELAGALDRTLGLLGESVWHGPNGLDRHL